MVYFLLLHFQPLLLCPLLALQLLRPFYFFEHEILDKYDFRDIKIAYGGKERQDSIYNGLKKLDSNSDIVLIHDGARPFSTTFIVSLTGTPTTAAFLFFATCIVSFIIAWLTNGQLKHLKLSIKT